MFQIIQQIAFFGLLAIVFIIGWAVGYKEGKQEQKEILLRLRKSIANSQG